ncbi:MAG: hypothetical protein WAN46_14810 [Gammaproteobacteria bacterium]|jgi:hypothetical protein
MMTILVSFIVMLFIFAGMAVGVLCGRPSIRGTCGGLNGVKGMNDSCLACAGVCKREKQAREECR